MRIKVLTVTEATAYIQRIFKSDPILGHISIQGEVSNYKRHSSGNLYFTLKDDATRLSCVCFTASIPPLAFEPNDGMRLLVKGSVQVYDREGKYQLYVKSMEPAGTGDLYKEFEQLKRDLQLLGYFEEKRKKKIPAHPKKIAILTSPTGAVIHDMLSVYRRKQPITEIIIVPTAVQGQGAHLEIIEGLQVAHALNADLIILARGGGSIEELWAFNEKLLAEAIYESKIPILSAVGHETDYTISDFVSDMRAPTPTAAAEATAISKQHLREDMDQMYDAMVYAVQKGLERKNEQLKAMAIDKQAHYLLRAIQHKKEVLTYEKKHMLSAGQQSLSNFEHKLSLMGSNLQGNSPLKPLERGYALLYKNDAVLSPNMGLLPDETVYLKRLDRTARCLVLEEVHNEDQPKL